MPSYKAIILRHSPSSPNRRGRVRATGQDGLRRRKEIGETKTHFEASEDTVIGQSSKAFSGAPVLCAPPELEPDAQDTRRIKVLKMSFHKF